MKLGLGLRMRVMNGDEGKLGAWVLGCSEGYLLCSGNEMGC